MSINTVHNVHVLHTCYDVYAEQLSRCTCICLKAGHLSVPYVQFYRYILSLYLAWCPGCDHLSFFPIYTFLANVLYMHMYFHVPFIPKVGP